jgi:hypothetical protein
MKKYWYTSSSGKVEIQLTMEQAERGGHSGSVDLDIAALRNVPEIKSQLEALSMDAVIEELFNSGAYDMEDLLDHDQNLSRILWFACGDIVEEYSE